MFKILIVDNNIPFRQVLFEILKVRFPFVVIKEASDGEEGLKKVKNFQPHLIFIDIHLPSENGLVLAKKIKTYQPDITIVLFASHNLPEYRMAAIQSGVDHFIPKDLWTGEQILVSVESIILEQGFNSLGISGGDLTQLKEPE